MSKTRQFIANSILRPLLKSVEGEYRPGPWYLPITGGWLPADIGNSMNWWQNGYDPIYSGQGAMQKSAATVTTGNPYSTTGITNGTAGYYRFKDSAGTTCHGDR